jgi:hypothetical protein
MTQLFAERGGPQPDPEFQQYIRFTTSPAAELFESRGRVFNQRLPPHRRGVHGLPGFVPRVPREEVDNFVTEIDRIGPHRATIVDLNAAEEIFYRLYFHIRSTLLLVILARETWRSKPHLLPLVSMPSLEHGAPQFVAFKETGRLTLKTDPTWLAFAQALEDVEPQRIRRCPECGAFFYAIRNNTQGCEKHRALLNVKRFLAGKTKRREK